ncbi:hypothetical protein [Daejeonella oryzae]|uniref:hypothetical protein n=1 Tax=Daejeonella oryzae TaxID=1122943 RepID=UPI000418E7BD|nr:hypothetical protein [Daejeonella oryzae]
MTQEDYQWHINLVKDRNHDLNLTFEQAEQIYKIEEDKSIYSEKQYFSAWEEMDYELSTFKKILNPKQFATFEINMKEIVENYQQSLIEQDTEKLIEIEFNKATIKYYEEQFLPGFFKEPLLYTFHWLSADKAKIEFLKAEYKKFLDDSRKRILIEHFRHYRTFKPNELEASLLQHKLSYLWPDYLSFKAVMDEPTKVITEYLKQKFKYVIEKYDEFIAKKLEELIVFNKENSDKYHDDSHGGWHTIVIGQTNTEEEEKEYRAMCVLLLDREKYGC